MQVGYAIDDDEPSGCRPSANSPPAPPAVTFAPCQCVDVSDNQRCVCLPADGDGLTEFTMRRLEKHYAALNAKDEL